MANPRKQKPASSHTAELLALSLPLVTLSIWLFSSRLSPLQLHAVSLITPSQFFPSDPCPQPTPIKPNKHALIWERLLKEATTGAYEEKVVEWLSGAIQIATESYDNMGPVGEDSRWEAFGPFHDYLSGAFPLVHSTLSVAKVNTWGLVYVWKSWNDSLRPLLLTAHQDVVPVNPDTVDKWIHPPYSGHFDGERIWGRGTADDKNGLVTILAAVEYLVSAGFEPARTLVLAFGFDEESSGKQGAGALSGYLLATFGRNSFALIVDEGGTPALFACPQDSPDVYTEPDGFLETYGSVTALPSVAEKGYIDVRLTVSSPGGHSSIPPAHTSIGLLATMIVELEANPTPVELSRDNVYYDTLVCMATHSANVGKDLRQAILDSVTSDEALKVVESMVLRDPETRSLVGTTRAIDIIRGGVKANALPEEAWVVINHRISTDSSVSQTIRFVSDLLQPLATKFNLSLTSFGETITDPTLPSYGSILLSDPWDTRLEPAPISPYKSSPAFRVLAGTIKSVYNTHRGLEGNDNIVVYPSYLFGNTDTRYYWELSENIYRYNHDDFDKRDGLGGIHTINENIRVDSLLEMIKFFVALILNTDEATDL
ncbi:carboxypeptidase S [Thelephora ganbajun]|uniref:Carboxypeptidase S n=1 Tax=Thelephora ganbajun TaxID=370292 RepID=A0ACB6ZHY3_THEGA|nr:carboxypeptidase S [Thelephora ganbajun]